jgi:hypothetical protein
MFDLYSMEADNDDIDIDFKETTNDETAADDAGSDSVTTDVSNISEEKTNHNEEASAGGVATGSNEDDIAVDPVVATESFVYRRFGLSREDVEETIEETINEAEAIPNADAVEAADSDDDAVGMTDGAASDAVVETPGAIVQITDPSTEIEGNGEPYVDTNDSNSEIAAVECLRRLVHSYEDGDEDVSASGADVELDVKTSNNDVNLQLEDQTVSITPNDTDAGEPAEGGDEDAATEPETEPAEGGDEGAEEPAEGGEGEGEGGEPDAEATEESWRYFFM